MNNLFIVIPAVTAYLAATGFITFRLVKGNPNFPSRWIGIGLCAVGLLFHGALIFADVNAENGINLGFFYALSLVVWTTLLMLMISAITKPVEVLGIPLLPLAGLAVVLEYVYPASHMIGPNAPWGLVVHILISIFAYSMLALASVQALALAFQDHQLHSRHPGGLIRVLPPLQTMELLLFEMIVLGFILLTLSLASGFFFLENMFQQHLVHKTVLSIVAWGVFGILVIGRFRYGWRGRQAIRWTLSGFFLLMVAYFGSKFVLEMLLAR